MSPIRRLYLYLVALLSWLAALTGVSAVGRELARSWVSGEPLPALLTGQAAPWLSLALVALLLWTVHWFLIGRLSRPLTIAGAAERGAAIRKAYLYIGQAFALAVALVQAALVVDDGLRRALGEPATDLRAWPAWHAGLTASLIIALIFWGSLRRVALRDGDWGAEAGAAASWRRAYFYGAAFAGTALVTIGGAEFIRAILRLAGDALMAPPGLVDGWRGPLATSGATLLIGSPLAVLAWGRANRLSWDAPGLELNALGRVSLLRVGALFGAAATLASLAYLLEQGLLIALGQPTGEPFTFWQKILIAPLAYLPVGSVAWIWFGRTLRGDAARGGERPATATVRRIAGYLASAVALGVFWFGLTELLRLVVVAAAGLQPAGQTPLLWARDRFAQAAALVVVAAPAWWAFWWPAQVRARAEGPDGRAERASPVRQVYLYGVALAAAMIVLFALARTVYQLLGRAAPGVEGLLAALAEGVGVGTVAAGVALFWWIAHIFVIRGDARWQAATEPDRGRVEEGAILPDETQEIGARVAGAPRQFQRAELPTVETEAPAIEMPAAGPPAMPAAVTVIDGGDGALGAALASALRMALPDVTVWPVGLNVAAQVAMLAAFADQTPPAVPADALARATLILGPCDILVPGGLDGEVSADLAAAVATGPARALLLPPRDPRLRWVAAPDWPIEQWIGYAVEEAVAELAGEASLAFNA